MKREPICVSSPEQERRLDDRRKSDMSDRVKAVKFDQLMAEARFNLSFWTKLHDAHPELAGTNVAGFYEGEIAAWAQVLYYSDKPATSAEACDLWFLRRTMANQELVKHEAQLPAVKPSEMTSNQVLLAILDVARTPGIDITIAERLFAMQERMVIDQRKVAFFTALTELESEIPQIQKSGHIRDNSGETRNKYALLEDIDTILKPLLTKHGFAFSFDEDWTDGKTFKLSCRMSHREGHAETKTISLPLDTGPGRSSIQSRGSTQKYGQRYLIGMHVNLVTRNEDDDGNGGSEELTDDEVKDLDIAAKEAYGPDFKRFLVYMHVGELKEILKRDLKKAYVAIDAKHEDTAKKGAR